MRPKTIATILFFLTLIFVGFGDAFLPKPLSTASATARSHVNQFIIGLFPYMEPIDNPHRRTEGEIERLDQNRRSN
jgi:hypothetical protein